MGRGGQVSPKESGKEYQALQGKYCGEAIFRLSLAFTYPSSFPQIYADMPYYTFRRMK